jgi:uncharacterized membrane protein YdjX (TVP38/TMEM64 family)
MVADWFRDLGIWAVMVSLLMSTVIAILGIVPTVFISGANAIVFGMIPGFSISLAGEVMGAGVSFWLYRWGFGKMKQVRNESWGWLQQMNGVSRKRKFFILLLARLTPLVPSGIITFAASVSRIGFSDFMAASFIGKVPSIAMESIVGHDLILLSENLPRLTITLISILLIYLLLKRNRKSN